MRKSILIVEDELRIRFLLRDYLIKDNFNVFEASNGQEGLLMISSHKIDLVLLDIMMPVMDGLTMLEKLREVSTVPVILLTAKGEEEDKLQGYDYGADDYITKPFSPKVLMAKVKALLKRTRNDIDSSYQEFNGLTINKLSHEVKVDGKEISLSPKEYELLTYLITNEGIALSRDNILDNVWGLDYYGDIRTVDTNVKRLREKLMDKSNLIVTVRGSGYKFENK
ncbi:response regulator transcription factor [Clostridium sp. SM-530-WT-3G]|uniref:response regulator transcription factor n=1 Tax=Clostridium sp. SM-530-WT-3G TaxID=2725303 RepID=UPI00145DD192|nr:response regulator transcription factor [Clostridium sp. SM-530-WT-3G]NME83217.1 response regulator transcription factor [Clostridium sp. SM-530-WT-3G]